MTTIAYIANKFPTEVEWYISEEISELRRRGFRVIPCTAEKGFAEHSPSHLAAQTVSDDTIQLRPLSMQTFFGGLFFTLTSVRRLADFWTRIFLEGKESWGLRIRALAHTFLGSCYAYCLRNTKVAHIHAHHGYYASWIAMVAAHLLGVPYSLTLHGSDLLVKGAYLDTKLANCEFCLTVSEFNRRYILAHFPKISVNKVLLSRLGVELPRTVITSLPEISEQRPLQLLSVGRLHAVKNHSFLIQACFFLREYGLPLHCRIAGDGPERTRLEYLIDELRLRDSVELLGHVPRALMGQKYEEADLVILTSHSEGIPLVLMEAMAHGRIVLAPKITGIPELVLDGRTGFLYTPGALEDFVWHINQLAGALPALTSVRRAAREHVREHFSQQINLRALGELFSERIAPVQQEETYANPVLQQV